MHARRVRRQDGPEHAGGGVERLHPAGLGGVPLVERFEVQPAREAGQHFLDVLQHVMHFECVAAAEHHRRAGGGRQVPHVVVERQFGIPARQHRVGEVVRGVLVDAQNVPHRNLAQLLRELRRAGHVSRDLATGDLAEPGDRLAGDVVRQGGLVEAGVRLAEAEGGNLDGAGHVGPRGDTERRRVTGQCRRDPERRERGRLTKRRRGPVAAVRAGRRGIFGEKEGIEKNSLVASAQIQLIFTHLSLQ